MTTMTEQELLPCPFCDDYGAELTDSAVPSIVTGKPKKAVYCNTCFCEGPTSDTEAGAVEAWNLRATETIQPVAAEGVDTAVPREIARQAQAEPVVTFSFGDRSAFASHNHNLPWIVNINHNHPAIQPNTKLALFAATAPPAAPAQAAPDAQYKAQRDRLLDFIKNAQVSSGVCMCGSSVEGHGFGDGHSPVDVWDYSVMKLIEEIEAQDATTAAQAATPADSQKGEGDE